jgi:uncharacterized protein
MQNRAPERPANRTLDEHDIDRLQGLLDAVPPPLEPLDVSMLDGYLCGVLLQPRPVPAGEWLPHVFDTDGRPLPAGFDAQPLRLLVQRRHAELAAAIESRQWFDPWVFELESEVSDPRAGGDADSAFDDDDNGSPAEAVYPWVAGFAAAMAQFPGLMASPSKALLEPLALLYRHLDPEDLEDADELLELIASLEPPADLPEAVEELVRATLLLADVSRPQAAPLSRRPPHRQAGRGQRSGRR